jgi:hypothetical protein
MGFLGIFYIGLAVIYNKMYMCSGMDALSSLFIFILYRVKVVEVVDITRPTSLHRAFVAYS